MADSEDTATQPLFDSEGCEPLQETLAVEDNSNTEVMDLAETEPLEVNDEPEPVVEEPDSENQDSERQPDTVDSTEDHAEKLCQLPLSRIKAIMKVDPEFQMASKEAVVLIAKAAEKFVAYITEEAARITFQHKKKTIQPRDVAESIQLDPTLEFLDGAMEDVIAELPVAK